MTQHMPPQAMTLFDLIARTWELDGAVQDILFNAAGTSLTAVLGDGRMAFVSVKDAEDPESRVRVEVDTGRASIRPRSKPLPAPVISETSVIRAEIPACRLGEQGFAFANFDTGELWRATARGQTLALKSAQTDPVTALAALPNSDRILVARGRRLALVTQDGRQEEDAVELPHEIARIAVSEDERLLGCWGPSWISIVTVDGLTVDEPIACEGQVLSLRWSPCNRWLVAGTDQKALFLVDVPAGTSDRIVDFPQAVYSAVFNTQAGALVASGAFRVVGWRLPDLPFGDHSGAPLETGKSGLTLVDRVASHPSRDLCAVSYVTGLVIICRVGHPDEMLVREGTGSPVTALEWSGDGAHLAIGDAGGNLSIATFPKAMFK